MHINSATTTRAYTGADLPFPRLAASADADVTDVTPRASDTSGTGTTSQADTPSSVKSFAYGAL